jgi:hypothetical protein
MQVNGGFSGLAGSYKAFAGQGGQSDSHSLHKKGHCTFGTLY